MDPGNAPSSCLRAVADTNVIAYYLLKTEPFYEEARQFWRAADEVWAPDSWRIELLNVLFMAVRAGVINLLQAETHILRSEVLVHHTCSVEALAPASLRLAVEKGHPAYDAAFVALSEKEGIPLATFDKALLQKFPEHAWHPSRIIALGSVDAGVDIGRD